MSATRRRLPLLPTRTRGTPAIRGYIALAALLLACALSGCDAGTPTAPAEEDTPTVALAIASTETPTPVPSATPSPTGTMPATEPPRPTETIQPTRTASPSPTRLLPTIIPSHTATATAPSLRVMYVSAKVVANIREAGEDEAEVMGTLERGTPVELLEHTGDWVKIQSDGLDQPGWIHASLLGYTHPDYVPPGAEGTATATPRSTEPATGTPTSTATPWPSPTSPLVVDPRVTGTPVGRPDPMINWECSQVDAPGDDNKNKAEEWVCVENRGDAPQELAHWSIKDEYGWTYVFPPFTLEAGAQVRVHTGCGVETTTDLFWCKGETAVWNNGGDTILLFDDQGRLVDSHTY